MFSSPLSKTLACMLVLCLSLFTMTPKIQAEEATGGISAEQSAAAHALFEAMQLEETFSKTIVNMVEMQVKQQPTIAPYKDVMLKFFEKHMSWKTLKDDMARIYVEEFSVAELNELTAFYLTPIGKKAATRTPYLMNKGAELGAKRVQENMPELQAMIAAEAQRASGAP